MNSVHPRFTGETDPTFDLSAYEAELAEMAAVQEEIDREDTRPRQERLAEALALLDVCRTMHFHRRAVLDAAVTRLSAAVVDAVEAREGYSEAGDLLTEAMRLVVLLRGGVV